MAYGTIAPLWRVKARSTIRCLLTLLAVAGLLLAPIMRPVSAVAMDVQMAAGQAGDAAPQARDGMPCCPEKPALPPCGKDCPFMLLCVGAPLHRASAVEVHVPRTLAEIILPRDRPNLVSIARAPPQRPPEI
jgi:hypothetical protein